MASVDLIDLRNDIVAHGRDGLEWAETNIGPSDIFVAMLIIGVILGGVYWYRRWADAKGYRMAVDHEEQRIKRLQSDGFNDLVLQWEVEGKLSPKQGDTLLRDLSKKLDLPDLIPRQRRAKIIKTEIKSRIATGVHKHANIPGDKPPHVKMKKETGNKFLKTRQG